MLEPIPFLGWFNWFEDAKPMTDEEIIDCCGVSGFLWSESKGLYVKHSNGSWIGIDEKILKLVKAIEEHHGIK